MNNFFTDWGYERGLVLVRQILGSDKIKLVEFENREGRRDILHLHFIVFNKLSVTEARCLVGYSDGIQYGFSRAISPSFLRKLVGGKKRGGVGYKGRRVV